MFKQSDEDKIARDWVIALSTRLDEMCLRVDGLEQRFAAVGKGLRAALSPHTATPEEIRAKIVETLQLLYDKPTEETNETT